jgi:hypothetical protein
MLVIRTLFNIILLKSKPDEVPFNINYTLLAFSAVLLSGLLSATSNHLITEPMAFVFVQIATLSGLICLFLLAGQKSERIVQTLFAILGTSAILQFTVYFLSLINLNILLIVLSIWGFVVQTYIILHALDIGKAQAFFISLGVQMSIVFALFMVFPDIMQAIILETQQAQTVNTAVK